MVGVVIVSGHERDGTRASKAVARWVYCYETHHGKRASKAVAMWVYCYETHDGTRASKAVAMWAYCYETHDGTLEFVYVEVIGTHAHLFPPCFVMRRCQCATLASDWTSRHVRRMPLVTMPLVTMQLQTVPAGTFTRPASNLAVHLLVTSQPKKNK